MFPDPKDMTAEAMRQEFAESALLYGDYVYPDGSGPIQPRRKALLEALRSLDAVGLGEVRPLAAHEVPLVRLATAFLLRESDRPLYIEVLLGLADREDAFGDSARFELKLDLRRKKATELDYVMPPRVARQPHKEHWQITVPPPAAMARTEIEARLRQAFPEQAEGLIGLLRPATGLWPQPADDHLPPTASRFGGLPVVPEDWSWPCRDEMPMPFVLQLNCADLAGHAAAAVLPARGMLAVFADMEAILEDPSEPGAMRVYHWPDIEALVPAPEDVLPDYIGPEAAIRFFDFLDLPSSEAAALHPVGLGTSEDNSRYFRLRDAILHHGVPEQSFSYVGGGKLLGWPDIVQQELKVLKQGDESHRLFLQLAPFNTENDHELWWGPGSTVYFLLPEADLAEGRLERWAYELQFD
jgi:hypothetical protein